TWDFYTEAVFSKDYEGAKGKERMKTIMTNLRKLRVGDTLANQKIDTIEDLLAVEQKAFPSSDVLIIRFNNGDKLVVRPSGTEPKIKYYLFFTSPEEERKALERTLDERIAMYKAALS
ncbi:MAG: phospho-sugar mutase, partial [Spirochaetia bacterium]|nr:phospho-sugar mutase [Spirochaetia bacterium]